VRAYIWIGVIEGGMSITRREDGCMRRLGAPDADLLNGYIFKLSQTVVADGYPDPAVDLLVTATPCRVEPLSTEFRHEC
jgi:hypothetical protein